MRIVETFQISNQSLTTELAVGTVSAANLAGAGRVAVVAYLTNLNVNPCVRELRLYSNGVSVTQSGGVAVLNNCPIATDEAPFSETHGGTITCLTRMTPHLGVNGALGIRLFSNNSGDTAVYGTVIVVAMTAFDELLSIGSTIEGSAAESIQAIQAKTDNLPASPAAQAKLDTLHDTRIPGVIQPQTGDSFARLGAPAGASVSADVAAVKSDTGSIKTKTDNLPAAPAAQAKLDEIHDNRLTSLRATNLDNLDATISSRLSSASYVAPDNSGIADAAAAAESADTKLGTPAGVSVSADIAAVKSDTGAIKAKTDNLPASPAAQAKLDVLHDTRIPGVVQPQTGDSFARLGAPTGVSVSADIAAIKSDTGTIITDIGTVDSKVDDIVADTSQLDAARNEPGQAAPPDSTSVLEKIDYLYKAFRNRIDQDGTTFKLYNNAGTVVDQKATVSDDGDTFTRGKIGSGP